MRKELKEKLRLNPERYELFLKKKREYRKNRLNRDPIYREKQKKKNNERSLKRRIVNRIKRIERRKNSPYWQDVGYKRYKRRIFQTLARYANKRCLVGKVTPIDLFSIAKKQKLICPLTGEKITKSNISLDHILPISRGGTNDKHNLRFVTFTANTAKNSMTDLEFIDFCRKIVCRNTPYPVGSTPPPSISTPTPFEIPVIPLSKKRDFSRA